ncbi:MAG TPA: hypothetical protein VN040_12835 [Pseudosphingobacterium sp.]|nr:hypothetical protein [Pseudosphingobacterium sp.]
MNKIITTTNTLEGWTIEEYHEPITANVVVEPNVFSDIAASWIDFSMAGRAPMSTNFRISISRQLKRCSKGQSIWEQTVLSAYG